MVSRSWRRSRSISATVLGFIFTPRQPREESFQHGPYEGEGGCLAGEPADHLRSPERAFGGGDVQRTIASDQYAREPSCLTCLPPAHRVPQEPELRGVPRGHQGTHSQSPGAGQARADRRGGLIDVYWQIGSGDRAPSASRGVGAGTTHTWRCAAPVGRSACGIPRSTRLFGAQSLQDAGVCDGLAGTSLRPYARPSIGACGELVAKMDRGRTGMVCRAGGSVVTGAAPSSYCQSPARARGRALTNFGQSYRSTMPRRCSGSRSGSAVLDFVTLTEAL